MLKRRTYNANYDGNTSKLKYFDGITSNSHKNGQNWSILREFTILQYDGNTIHLFQGGAENAR